MAGLLLLITSALSGRLERALKIEPVSEGSPGRVAGKVRSSKPHSPQLGCCN